MLTPERLNPSRVPHNHRCSVAVLAGGIPASARTGLTRTLLALTTLLLALPLNACRQATAADILPPALLPQTTNIVLTDQPLQQNLHRFGINLSGQSFYDSGQILRNLTFRNPGFEGGTWQSILRCKAVKADTCTDENQYTVWPAGFLQGAHYQVLNGAIEGTVLAQSANNHGVTLQLDNAVAAGDFLLVRIAKPGNAEAGWWTGLQAGATLATELHDLSPGTAGKQALRIEAAAPGQSAKVVSYFDSFADRSFLQMHGVYTLHFRAKGLSGSPAIQVKLERLDTKHGVHSFFVKAVPLTADWKDYDFAFTAEDLPGAIGSVGLTFEFDGTAALLDDVSLTEAAAPNNPTPFRNAVVQALRDLHPGILRYMDSGGNFGSSFSNMIAPVFARERTGASTQEALHEDIPLGLHEFLTLCKAIGAEPWYSMPPGTSPAEAAATIEYLAGPASSPYGHRRAALGQADPWTHVFPAIHLELGNEQWNARSFAGSTINDPAAYGRRAAAVFGAMRASRYFAPQSFDLILGSWSALPWWTGKQLEAPTGADTVALAPYLFTDFRDASSDEAVFGPMLAQPQQIDGPGGLLSQQRSAARGLKLAIYETNLGTMSGSATQPQVDSAVPSLGAGLAVVEHMLLMQRDLGIDAQCLFALPQYSNSYTALDGTRRTMPLWGAVLDMGGPTNLRRPTFLAEQLANSAILPTQLRTLHSAPDPTWNQPKSANDNIEMPAAKLIESFAFTDGHRHSLILLNLSRTDALPVTFSGAGKPTGAITEQRLSASMLTSSNEHSEQVRITRRTITPAERYLLPAHSMTVLTW